MAEKTISVRTALMPAYYKDFHCIMGACQDNCCDDGWKIEFSKKDYLTVKRAAQSEELKTMVKQGMHRLREREHNGMYAEFQISEMGCCAFHTKEGLCALQQECGEAALPRVCRLFPRRPHYTAAAKEFPLSPACEEVLALLWDLPQGIDFWEEPLEKKDWRTFQPSHSVDARFADIRSLCIDVLQERSLSLPRRILLLGVLLQRLQGLDWGNETSVEAWLSQSFAMLHDSQLTDALDSLPQNKRMFITNNHQVLLASAIGSRNHAAFFQELWGSIFAVVSEEGENHLSFDMNRYEELERNLDELLRQSESFFENLMVTVAFFSAFPTLTSPEELWKSYVNLCNIYSLYRFSAVCGCDKEVSRERLFRVLVRISRTLLHDRTRSDQLRDNFFQNDSATLAHMAILLGG